MARSHCSLDGDVNVRPLDVECGVSVVSWLRVREINLVARLAGLVSSKDSLLDCNNTLTATNTDISRTTDTTSTTTSVTVPRSKNHHSGDKS